jgi:hypothetical protein
MSCALGGNKKHCGLAHFVNHHHHHHHHHSGVFFIRVPFLIWSWYQSQVIVPPKDGWRSSGQLSFKHEIKEGLATWRCDLSGQII